MVNRNLGPGLGHCGGDGEEVGCTIVGLKDRWAEINICCSIRGSDSLKGLSLSLSSLTPN